MVSSMFSITLVTLLLETLCALELDEESHGKLTTKSLFWAPKGGRTRFGTIQKRLVCLSIAQQPLAHSSLDFCS